MARALPHPTWTVSLAAAAGLLVGGPLAAPAAAAPAKSTISGVVWSDVDGDGVRERGEPLVKGARVTIARQRGRAFKTARRLATDRRGAYSWAVQTGERYRVTVALPPGFSGFSAADRGSDRLDSDLRPRGRSAAFTVKRGGKGSKRIDAGLRAAGPAPTPTAPLTQPVSGGPAAPTPTLVPVPVPEPEPVPPTTPEPTTPEPTSPPPSTARTVSGRVWSDANANGLRAAGESNVGGITVELWNADRSARLAETSAVDGTFTLPAETGGTYRLRALLPVGATFSPTQVGADRSVDSEIERTGPHTGFSAPFTVTGSTATADVGVVFTASSQVGNFVFHDVDGSGVYAAATDEPLQGASVELWNESRTQRLAVTSSSASGAYALQAPRGVNYSVRFVKPVGNRLLSDRNVGTDDGVDSDAYEDTEPLAGFTDVFPVAASPVSTIDAGFYIPRPVGDRVWDDLDADGIQDRGELGVAGVNVQLWNGTRDRLYALTTTSATGTYMFMAKGLKSYSVRVLLPSGASFSPKAQGSDREIDSDVNPVSPFGFTDAFVPDDIFAKHDIGLILP